MLVVRVFPRRPSRLPMHSLGHPDRQARHLRRQPRVETLETRQLLSGFGPEDGAYIVETPAGRYEEVKIQSADQKIVAAGTFVVGTGPALVVARYDPVGNPDASYGSAGTATLPSLIFGAGLTLQPDGKAVVTSKFGYDFRLDRLNVDGSRDAGFGTGGSTVVNIQAGSDVALGVGLQSGGKIVAAGLSTSSTTTANNQSSLVSRLTASGTLDRGAGGFGQTVGGTPAGYTLTSFGGKSQQFNDMVVQPDDKLVAAGVFTPQTGNNQLLVARYTASGTLDKTFNGKGYTLLALPGLSISASAVVMQADGRIVASGFSSGTDGVGDMLVARFNTNGKLDSSFAGGAGYVSLDIDGNASVTQEQSLGVAIQPDGKMVVAGYERAAVNGSVGSVLVARLDGV